MNLEITLIRTSVHYYKEKAPDAEQRDKGARAIEVHGTNKGTNQ